MFSIRPISTTDIPELRELVFRIWPQTYASLLPAAQIDYMLDMMYSESSLEKQIDEGANFIFLEEEGRTIGFASYQEMKDHIFKLHKLYILPSQQGKGTGRYLLEHIVGEIRKQGAHALQLQVYRHNKAKQFYEKLGFVTIDEFKFPIGNGYVMDDYIMQLSV